MESVNDMSTMPHRATCLSIAKTRGQNYVPVGSALDPTKTARMNNQELDPTKTARTNFNSYLIYGFLLLSVILPLCTAYPSSNNGQRSSLYGKNPSSGSGSYIDVPHWVNPCNGTYAIAERSSSAEEQTVGVFVNVVKVTCRQAIFQFERFRDAYVKKTFKVGFREHHLRFKDMVYEWLVRDTNVSKGLGEVVPREQLESLSLEDVATSMYGHLQRIAVGFEQIVIDQRNNNNDFKEEFAIADNNLRRILCEVRELIPDETLKNFENANRDIMKNHRHMSHLTDQHIRDWMIFRDYMSLVEYIEQVMTYFDAKLNGTAQTA